MKTNKAMSVGVLLLLTFVILSASKAVYLASMLQGKDPIVLLLLTFAITATFFNVLELRDVKAYKASITGSFRDIALLNVFSASSWISYFYAIKYLEPAVHASVANSTGPLITIVAVLLFNTSEKVTRAQVVAAIGILLSVLVLVYSTVTGRTAVGTIPTGNMVFGLVMALLCGVSIVCITFLSKRLNKAGWKSSRIMAARFIALLLSAWALLPAGGLAQVSSQTDAIAVVVIAVFGVIIPVYCSQLGMEKVRDPMTVSLMIALLPLCMFGLQMFDSRLKASYFSLAGILSALVFTGYGIVVRFRETGRGGKSKEVEAMKPLPAGRVLEKV